MAVAVGNDGRVIGARRIGEDGTDMSVPYSDRAIASTVVTVERRA